MVDSLAIAFKTKRSNLWLCNSTVENVAIRDYGRKIGYALRDEKEESFTKDALYNNILVTNQENNPFVRKKDCFPETAQKCRPYCNRTNPYGYIFAVCAKKFTKSSYIALFTGLFS